MIIGVCVLVVVVMLFGFSLKRPSSFMLRVERDVLVLIGVCALVGVLYAAGVFS